MKNYSRCAICDYLEGHGSELLDIPNRWNKRVRWRTKHNEYQCDDCFNEIRGVNYEYSKNDFNDNESEQDDSPVPSTMSPLPIE